jgi:integrase
MKATKIGNQYQITYRCPNYPKLINERFSSLELANLRIAQIELERKMGTLLPPPELVDPERQHSLYRETITVRQLMEEYVEMYGLSHWGEATLSCNQHRINDYILPYIGDIPVKRLTTHRLEKFYRQLLTEPAVKMKGREQEERTISPSVVEKVHAVLRSALNQAIRWDYLQGNNPAMAVELPRYKKGKREAWTDQESLNALNLCTDPILTLCMYLALGCSMRIGEILGLTWDCVHIEDDLVEQDEAYLIVDKELRRSDKRSVEKLRAQGRDDVFFTFPAWKQTESTTVLVLKTPETESSVRSIYIPQTVAKALREQQEVQKCLKRDLASEYQDYNLVVAQANGRPHEERQIAAKFNQLISKNNLRPVVFHSLRHSSTSLKLKISGGDIKTGQKDTGQSQSRMVTDVYSHSFDDDRKHLARKVDKLFFAQNETRSAPKPAGDPSTEEAMKILQNSPEMAQAFLQMAKLLKKEP